MGMSVGIGDQRPRDGGKAIPRKPLRHNQHAAMRPVAVIILKLRSF
jgi:hypothetical protein